MKFVDEATLLVRSGDGGRGSVSFRRERFVPKGGPDGGDGGKGGDIVLRAGGRRTLYHFHFKHRFRAQNGRPGQGSQRTGKNGEDLEILVPAGTLVKDPETGQILKDFTQEGESWIAARGGRGGKGNKHFATSTHRTPRFAQDGETGVELTLKLELKLMADVGLVGLPNAGKSSLIAAMSRARPRVGAYPFTTLHPSLGVVENPYGEPFVVADIPGLIEGAHEGAGLGTRFLRHVERTRALVHVIDAADLTKDDPLSPMETVLGEMAAHEAGLAEKPRIVVLNKMDLPEALEGAERFKERYTGEVFMVSAVSGQGVTELIREMARMIEGMEQGEEGADLE